MRTPAIVIARDRLGCLMRCVRALAEADLDVHVVDHGTTYEPLLDWYSHESADAGVVGVWYRGTWPPRSLWEWAGLEPIVGTERPYIVTDPDVVPDEGCPADWPAHLLSGLARWPNVAKAGMALRIDDLPAEYEHADRVRRWESRWWASGRFDERSYPWYHASVDTTLAAYPPLGHRSEFALDPSVRTGFPYVARHLPWYRVGEPPADEVWYDRHLTAGISHWRDPATYEGSGSEE